MLSRQSCPTICDPMNCSLPGSSVHGDSPGENTGVGCHALLQGIFPNPDRTQASHIAGRFFTIRAIREGIRFRLNGLKKKKILLPVLQRQVCLILRKLGAKLYSVLGKRNIMGSLKSMLGLTHIIRMSDHIHICEESPARMKKHILHRTVVWKLFGFRTLKNY